MFLRSAFQPRITSISTNISISIGSISIGNHTEVNSVNKTSITRNKNSVSYVSKAAHSRAVTCRQVLATVFAGAIIATGL